MPITYNGTQYSGIWTMQQVNSAISAGTWPTQPAPYLYTWGTNAFGQLGLGNITPYSSPKQVGSLTTWSSGPASSIGVNFTAAIKTDGTLWAWGINQYGQLGSGNTTFYSSPKQVGALTNWSSVTLGYQFTAAVKTDGTLWTWGRGATFGSLGLGNTTNYSSPKQVGSLTNWLNISAGYYHVIAVKTDGTLWSWGNNTVGELGLNNTTRYSSPKQVGGLTNWLKASASGYFNHLVRADGTLWTWGRNDFGQLGQGNTVYRSSPVQVGALTSWSKAVGGVSSALAIKTDGTLWAWGNGGEGVLGLGNQTSYSSPKQVGASTDWSIPTVGYYTSAVIKTNGTLWTWGQNTTGQLGFGTVNAGYSSPKQVGSLTTWTTITGLYGSLIGIASA